MKILKMGKNRERNKVGGRGWESLGLGLDPQNPPKLWSHLSWN